MTRIDTTIACDDAIGRQKAELIRLHQQITDLQPLPPSHPDPPLPLPTHWVSKTEKQNGENDQ
jgi:hypothetical protein